jgi:hypothetical protein
MAHAHLLAERLDRVPVLEPAVDPDGLQDRTGEHEGLHELGLEVQRPVGGVPVGHGPALAHDLGGALRVVPVAVGEPQHGKLAALGLQDGLHLGPDAQGRVDKDRCSQGGIGQQVGVGRDRARGQDMDVHTSK